MSSCLHVYMHIKNIMFNILTIFFNWSKFLLNKFMTWYFLDKKFKNAEYGKIPFVSAKNFSWNWNYAKNCHFLKLWLTEHLKGSEEYYFRLPRKEIHKKKKKIIQIALKLSKLWGFMFYKMASERDPLEKRHRPTENQ